MKKIWEHSIQSWGNTSGWAKFASVGVVVSCLAVTPSVFEAANKSSSGLEKVFLFGILGFEIVLVVIFLISAACSLTSRIYKFTKQLPPVSLVTCLFLIVGIFAHFENYAFFEMLRLVVTAAGFFVSYKMFKVGCEVRGVLFALIGFLFNPAFPIHIQRELWQIVDGLVAALFVWIGLQKGGDLHIPRMMATK